MAAAYIDDISNSLGTPDRKAKHATHRKRRANKNTHCVTDVGISVSTCARIPGVVVTVWSVGVIKFVSSARSSSSCSQYMVALGCGRI